MEIQIDPHTLARAKERGTNEREITETIESGIVGTAKGLRKMKSKVFSFNATRNNKFYDHKKIEVYYTETQTKIITVTVYVFYGKWEE